MLHKGGLIAHFSEVRGGFLLCESADGSFREEVFKYGSKIIVRTAILEAISVPQTCDPMGSKLCQAFQGKFGQSWSGRALADTKRIYNYARAGEATREQIAKEFNWRQKELEKHFLSAEL